MEHIIRDITIGKITGDKLESDSKFVVNFFNDLFSKLVFKRLNDNSNTIYMLIDDIIYMEQDYKNGEPIEYLWCKYEDYWKVIESKLGSKYTQTQYLIKYMVEEHLKKRIGTPVMFMGSSYEAVEEHLKKRAGTHLLFTKRRRT